VSPNPSPVRRLAVVLTITAVAALPAPARQANETTRIVVEPAKARQTFDGLGAGAIFYEGHVTSLAARNKDARQEELFDDMFAKVNTRFLQLMIRETHEPVNDNDDPYTPAFDNKNFEYCKHTVRIAKAALKRRPDTLLYATLFTPPPWMKPNNAATAGGEARVSLRPGLELELAEYVWAFAAHMSKNGVPIQYLSIANEPDWPHTQPGYCLTPDRHAALFKTVGEYLEKMAKKYPDVPRPKLVGPNTLSAVGAAKDYVPRTLAAAGKYLDVVAAHDYDPRGDRWGALRKLAGPRPVWLTEWCARKKDASPGMIDSAVEYGAAMHDTFAGGANVFLAYDWAYPPRDSGEALVHIDWGNDYKLTKPYHLFRQWADPLAPGMKVVTATWTGRSAAGVRPTAFLAADGGALIVHVVNTQDKAAPVSLQLTGRFAAAATAARTRTTATEDAAPLPALTPTAGRFADTLPAKSLTTYRVAAAGK
jgi:O-glycosyl hydrolase